MDANKLRASNPSQDSRESDGDKLETKAHRPSGRGELEVRCPSCHAPMEVAVDTPLTDLTCSTLRQPLQPRRSEQGDADGAVALASWAASS